MSKATEDELNAIYDAQADALEDADYWEERARKEREAERDERERDAKAAPFVVAIYLIIGTIALSLLAVATWLVVSALHYAWLHPLF